MIRLDPTDLPTDSTEMNDLKEYGLEGYWWETERQVCIPMIISTSATKFMAFLYEQEAKQNKAIVFPTVISARLAKLLRIRGYQEAWVYVDYMNEDCNCLVLRPEKISI